MCVAVSVSVCGIMLAVSYGKNIQDCVCARIAESCSHSHAPSASVRIPDLGEVVGLAHSRRPSVRPNRGPAYDHSHTDHTDTHTLQSTVERRVGCGTPGQDAAQRA